MPLKNRASPDALAENMEQPRSRDCGLFSKCFPFDARQQTSGPQKKVARHPTAAQVNNAPFKFPGRPDVNTTLHCIVLYFIFWRGGVLMNPGEANSHPLAGKKNNNKKTTPKKRKARSSGWKCHKRRHHSWPVAPTQWSSGLPVSNPGASPAREQGVGLDVTS